MTKPDPKWLDWTKTIGLILFGIAAWCIGSAWLDQSWGVGY